MQTVCVILPSNRICSPNNIALRIAEGIAANAKVTVLYLKAFDTAILQSQKCVLRKMTVADVWSLRKFDVVHSHMLKADLINGLFSLLFKPAQTKTVSTIHSNIDLDLSTYIRSSLLARLATKLWFWGLNALDTRVVVSGSLGRRQQLYLNDYRVIHNGFPAPPTTATSPPPIQRNVQAKRLQIGLLSRLHPGKGIEDAFFLAANAPHLDVAIYGDGKLAPRCQAEAAKRDNLFVHGYADNIEAAFNHIDILLMPSRHEGFPMTLLESLHYATPIICYDLPVFREILGSGDFYFQDTTTLLSVLSHFIDNRDAHLRAQLARLPLFTDRIMVKKYQGLYG